MAGFAECVEEIIRASGGILSKRDAAALLRKFNDTAQRMSAADRYAALDAMLTEARNNMVQRNQIYAIHNKRSALQHEIKVKDAASKIDLLLMETGKGVKEAFDTLLFGNAKHPAGLVQIWSGAVDRFNIALGGELEAADLLGHWQDPDTLANAIDVAFDPSAPVATPEAQKIGNILRQVQKLAYRRLNEAGAYVLDTPRILFNSKGADPALVRAFGKEEFINYVKTLDLDERYFDGMDNYEVDEFFGKVYDNLAEGNNYRAPSGTFDGVGGLTASRYRQLATGFSIDYDIPFASAESYKDFMKTFSSEPLQAIIARRVDQIGRGVGLMEAFGPVPERFFDELLAQFSDRMTENEKAFLLSKTAKAGTFKDIMAAPLKGIVNFYSDAHPKAVLADLSGITKAPVDTNLARFWSGFRALTSMAALKAGVFLQMTDLPIKGAILSRFGDKAEAALAPFTAIASAFPDKEKQLFYRRMGIGLQLLQNNLALEVSGGASKASLWARFKGVRMAHILDVYFKLNGMAIYDRVQKQSSADFLSSNLAWALGNPEGKGILDQFARYGFDEADFTKLRTAVVEFDGIHMIDPQVVRDTDDKLYEKFLGIMGRIVNDATPTPGVRERAVLDKGTRPGTWEGEMLRTFMMFKSYPVMLMTRIFPRIHYEQGVAGVMSTMVSMALMWYLGDSLKQLADGKTPKSLGKAETWALMATRSGFGGIYSDLITSEYDRYGMDFASAVGGPVVGRLNDLASLYSAAVHFEQNQETGEFKSRLTGKMAMAKLRKAMPNVFYFQTMLDRSLLYGIMESIDPGSLQESDKRLQEQFGQQRLF